MKCKECGTEIKETKKKIQIKNRFTDEVIYESETAKTIKECVEEAIKNGANLWEADLREANLREADLREADLREADLREANLSRADLREADLSRADLSRADLREANLREADLTFCKMDKNVFKQITEGWFEWKVED